MLTLHKDFITLNLLHYNVLFNKSGNTIVRLPQGKKTAVYELPAAVTTIKTGAFANTQMQNIIMGNNLSTIGKEAFFGCAGLKSVIIPVNVTFLGEDAFKMCILTGLTILSRTVMFGENSIPANIGAAIYGYDGSTAQTYAYDNGILFISLDAAVPELDFIVPAGMTVIEQESFENCAFACVRLNNNISSIEKLAFAYSPNLRHVYIDAATVSIAPDALKKFLGLPFMARKGVMPRSLHWQMDIIFQMINLLLLLTGRAFFG